jgi:flagellar motility protein MotE (MotC chaperone)
MIKNLAIGGVVGLLFMSGGFYFGLRFVHVPVPKIAVAAAPTPAETAKAARDAISIDALQKTSQGMMDMNQALQARELAVAAREKKAQQLEDELDAERAALDRSHAKFHALYGEFASRLQLVQANEADQLQRQLTIYTAMDPAQAADLLRSLDDDTIVRLFSMMDTKPLANLVAAWKTKYPADSTRVLTALTRMGTVMPADKIALSDPSAGASASALPADAASNPGNVAANPAPVDSAPADGSASSAPTADSGAAPMSGAADGSTAPATAPADMTLTPANSSSSDAAPVATPAPADSGSSADTSAPATDASSSATSAPATPTPDAISDASGTDSPSSPAASAPATGSAPQAPSAPAAPSLSPPPDTSSGHGAAVNPPVSVPTDTPSLLGVPGATGAQAAVIAQRRTGRLTADISTNRSY